MTLQQFALRAIKSAMYYRRLSSKQAFNVPEVAAWVKWSMRGSAMNSEAKQDYNHARRVMQRAGRRRV